jgi:hypothetical protein
MKDIRTVIMLVLFTQATVLLESQKTMGNQISPPVTNQPDETYIIGRLQAALSSTQFAVRLYYHGACTVDGRNGLLFPSVTVLPAAGNERGVAAIREMFRDDKSVLVSVDSSNVVRIYIGHVYKPVLDTPLSSIMLTTTAQYNPGGAIDLLESAVPVQAAMREFGMVQESDFLIGLVQPAIPNRPHLPPTISGVTLDQALDTISTTFPGVVVYGECENRDYSHLTDIKDYSHIIAIYFDWYR